MVMASEPEEPPKSEPEQDEDEIEIEDTPKPKPRKKEKKVVPLGRNGLKKRRVMKTRMFTDAKGFMGAYPCIPAWLCIHVHIHFGDTLRTLSTIEREC